MAAKNILRITLSSRGLKVAGFATEEHNTRASLNPGAPEVKFRLLSSNAAKQSGHSRPMRAMIAVD
jgi:hypothetical protein